MSYESMDEEFNLYGVLSSEEDNYYEDSDPETSMTFDPTEEILDEAI